MKRLNQLFMLFLIVLSIACRDQEFEVISEKIPSLPGKIGSLTSIDSNNKNLNVFLKHSDVDKKELDLNQVRLMKFKELEGVSAFVIPMTTSDKQGSRNLLAIFPSTNFTNYKILINTTESFRDEDNIEHEVLTVTKYDNTQLTRIEYIDGLLALPNDKSKNL